MRAKIRIEGKVFRVLKHVWLKNLIGFYIFDHPVHDHNHLIRLSDLPQFTLIEEDGREVEYV